MSEAKANVEQPKAGVEKKPAGGTILIAEDDHVMVAMLESRLRKEGYEIILAGNGQEGLEKIKEKKPDLIITDVLMPIMDGASFYREVKKNAETDKIPFLILTARSKMEESFKVMGVDEFISKPYQEQELMEKVRFLMSAPPAQTNLSEEYKQVLSQKATVGEEAEKITAVAVPFVGIKLNENTRFILMLVGMLFAFIGVAILLFKIAGA